MWILWIKQIMLYTERPFECLFQGQCSLWGQWYTIFWPKITMSTTSIKKSINYFSEFLASSRFEITVELGEIQSLRYSSKIDHCNVVKRFGSQ